MLAGATTALLAGTRVDVAGAGERGAVLLIPGYRPDRARLRGWPIAHHPELARGVPAGWDGPRTLLTRIGPDGSVLRAVLPIAIHQVAPAPDRRRAFVSSLEGENFLLIELAGLDHPAGKATDGMFKNARDALSSMKQIGAPAPKGIAKMVPNGVGYVATVAAIEKGKELGQPVLIGTADQIGEALGKGVPNQSPPSGGGWLPGRTGPVPAAR